MIGIGNNFSRGDILINYIKEVIEDTVYLYRYYTLKGKFVLTAIAILTILNALVGRIYDVFEAHIFTLEERLRKGLSSCINNRR